MHGAKLMKGPGAGRAVAFILFTSSKSLVNGMSYLMIVVVIDS